MPRRILPERHQQVLSLYYDEGLTMKEATGVLQGLRGMNIVGGDVVCMMPTKDSPNKITAINASVIMFEQICLIADRVGTIRPL